MLKFLTKHYKLILISGAVFGLVDSLITTYLIQKQLYWHSMNLLQVVPIIEVNPLMLPFAGTIWLPIIKIGYPLIFLLIIEIIKFKERNLNVLKS
jgi:hypothetical protein